MDKFTKQNKPITVLFNFWKRSKLVGYLFFITTVNIKTALICKSKTLKNHINKPLFGECKKFQNFWFAIVRNFKSCSKVHWLKLWVYYVPDSCIYSRHHRFIALVCFDTLNYFCLRKTIFCKVRKLYSVVNSTSICTIFFKIHCLPLKLLFDLSYGYIRFCFVYRSVAYSLDTIIVYVCFLFCIVAIIITLNVKKG